MPQVDDLQGINVMLADRLEEWAHQYEAEGMQKGMQQGMQQGIQQGMQQGEALALQKLITRRFGTIAPDVLIKITAASKEQLDVWLDQVLDADSLNDLFGPDAG